MVSEISMTFDPSGVFAFSQGATLAALVSLLSEQPPWKFAILVSGFDPLDETVLGRLPKDPCLIPTMHVIGAADSFVPRARTEALASRFVSPQIYDHEVCAPSCLSKATVSFCYVSVDVSKSSPAGRSWNSQQRAISICGQRLCGSSSGRRKISRQICRELWPHTVSCII